MLNMNYGKCVAVATAADMLPIMDRTSEDVERVIAFTDYAVPLVFFCILVTVSRAHLVRLVCHRIQAFRVASTCAWP